MISSQTVPTRTIGQLPTGLLANNGHHPPVDIFAPSARPPKRHPFNSSRVRYHRSWFSVGAATTALSLLGIRHYGRPAAAGMGVLGLVALGYMTLVEPSRPNLQQITLRLPGLPQELDGLRVGQITDSHLGMPHAARNLAWAVEQMRRERPDLLALTGDLVSKRRAIPDLPVLLRGLHAPLGIYAVPGNHDYWEGLADLRAALSLLGIPLLINEHRRLDWNGASLWLVGLDDLWDGHPNFDAALHGVPDGACTLLLAHVPDIADEAARHGIAAQLSGHTHGGHLRLPFLGPFALPRFGWRYAMGHYPVGGLALYVSRGLSGGPFRLLCRPEATIITLRRG